jgi:NAD(P)-dependent dehydrogenase (short-subunit alcohol dehydrogenase family)
VSRVAVVTGGASGIGLAMARRFAQEGLRVVIADVDQDKLNRAAEELHVLAVRADVSQADEVERLRDAALAEHGRVDIVCNNAGVTTSGRIMDLSLAEWRWVLEINLWGVIHGVHTFLPVLAANQDGGHIINTASGAGLAPAWATSPYSVSKYGIVSLSETLRLELADDAPNVRVSVLIPTATATGIAESEGHLPPGVRARTKSAEELKREEVKRRALAAGMSPDVVADKVWAAVLDHRFWIFPWPGHAEWVMTRAKEIQLAARE